MRPSLVVVARQRPRLIVRRDPIRARRFRRADHRLVRLDIDRIRGAEAEDGLKRPRLEHLDPIPLLAEHDVLVRQTVQHAVLARIRRVETRSVYHAVVAALAAQRMPREHEPQARDELGVVPAGEEDVLGEQRRASSARSKGVVASGDKLRGERSQMSATHRVGRASADDVLDVLHCSLARIADLAKGEELACELMCWATADRARSRPRRARKDRRYELARTIAEISAVYLDGAMSTPRRRNGQTADGQEPTRR